MRLITIGQIIAMAAILSAPAGGAPAPSQPHKNDTPAILAGSEVDYPPFCIVQPDGRADGFSVELLRAALQAMGHDVTFRTGPWTNVKGWLEQGEVQALPMVGRTPEREEAFDFTFPYLTMHGAIVVRKDTTSIRSLVDLRGKRVAVMASDNAEEYLRREKRGIEILALPTFTDALLELSRGTADAVVIQRLVALRLLQETGLKNLRIVDHPIPDYRQDFCFAVKEGDAATLALLNEGLALVMADGTHRRLHAKWFASLELPDGRIIVGGDHNYPPFEFLDEKGRPAGFAVEITRAIAEAANLDIEIRLGPWAEIVEQMTAGRIDAIQGMFYLPERDRIFDFSQPYLVSAYVGVTRKDHSKPPASLQELAERKIVVQESDVLHGFLQAKSIPIATLAQSQEEVLRAVAEGQADCGIVMRSTALSLIRDQVWNELALGKTPIFNGEYCYAVPQGHAALMAKFSEGLEMIEANGEYRRIRKKWMSVYDPPTLRTILRHLVWVAGPLLLMLLGIFLWSWALRRQVKRKTRELRESEALYRHIIENIHDIIFTVAPDGTFTFVSPAWTALLGHPIDKVVGHKFHPFVHPDDLATCVEALRGVTEKGERRADVEFRVQHMNGTWRWYTSNVTPLSDENNVPIGLEGIGSDITERRMAEENYRTLFNQMLDGFALHEMIYNAEGKPVDYRFLAVNPAFERLTGLKVKDITGKRMLEVLPETERHWIEVYGKVTQTGEPAFFENYAAELDKYFEVMAFRPKPGQFACVFADITERKKAENALRDSMMKQETMVRAANIGLWDWDLATNTILYSKELKRQIGYEEHELKNHYSEWESRVHPDDLKPTLDSIRASIASTASHNQAEFRFRHKNGSYRWILAQSSILRNETGKALRILGSHVDITESKEANLQLQQAQKMESVGRLAGGVAHDFNNLLMSIMGNVTFCLDALAPDHPIREWLNEIMQDAERSARLTRQLLAFARKQTIAPVVLDINDVVSGMLKLLRRLIGEDINLVWAPGARLWPIKMDPGQMDQLLANLCVNARDAIADVGKITIDTKNSVIDKSYCDTHVEAIPGVYVTLSVSDDGCGMDRNTLDHLFEPFFTTKPRGEGTGLGLATVYGIVKQNNGFINVYSEPGHGTTFRIYLPRTEETTEAPPAPSTPAELPGGTETILLAEDDKTIRVMVRKILEKLGYTVLEAPTPQEALHLGEEHAGRIQLVISDVIMPDMNGRELAEKLTQRNPGLKCLFMSGYTANVVAHRGILDDGISFLAKPFTRADLAHKIREILGGM